jgi:hypothetical protein
MYIVSDIAIRLSFLVKYCFCKIVVFGKMMGFNGYKLSSYNGLKYYKGIKYNNYHIEEEDDYDN